MVDFPQTADEFRAWRDLQPYGSVVNDRRPGDVPMLHRANCFYLTWNEKKTKREKLVNWVRRHKACSLDRNELIAMYRPELVYCSYCQKP